MKYRGGHSSNFNGASYYHHQARPNGSEHVQPKANRSNGGTATSGGGGGGGSSGGGGGQGQIELVEKILSQISMHQSSNVGNSARPRSGLPPLANSDRTRNNTYGKKNPTQHYNNSNYQNRFKNNKFTSTGNSSSFSSSGTGFKEHRDRSFSSSVVVERSSLSNGGDASDCPQCEYVFADGQLLPKTECTHKGPSKKTTSTNSAAQVAQAPSQAQPARIVNHLNQVSETSKFVPKATSSKAYVNRTKKSNNQNGANSQQQQHQQQSHNVPKESTRNGTFGNEPNINPRQCIIPKNKCTDMKKFVEAQIVFDRNIIDVVPVQGDQIPILSVSPVSQLANSSEASQANCDFPEVEPAKQVEVVEPIVLEPVSSDAESDSECSLSEPIETCVVSRSPSISSSPPLSSKPVVRVVSLSSQKKPSSVISSIVHQSNAQPQTVKKIRCLIANFITIQVEDDFSEESNHSQESNGSIDGTQDEILQLIDREKLGFQNFDGKNIGLYKNIGYINRNKAKFVRPTEELLQLLLSSKAYSQTEKYSSGAGESQSKDDFQRNLQTFYDLQSSDSYDKEHAYSVLESLINDDGQLTSQIKARKYRYPDCDYSESDDYHSQASRETFVGNSKSGSISTDRQRPSSLTDKSSHWFESDNEQVDSSHSHSSHCPSKFTMTRYIKNSALYGGKSAPDLEKRSISTEPISEASGGLEDQLYGSYYITEVSFSA